jgi:hypothetical protein
MSIKNYNDTIGKRTRDLPAYSASTNRATAKTLYTEENMGINVLVFLLSPKFLL